MYASSEALVAIDPDTERKRPCRRNEFPAERRRATTGRVRGTLATFAHWLVAPLVIMILIAALGMAPAVAHAAFTPETNAAYQKYIAALEVRLAAQNHLEGGYLWIDGDVHRQQSLRSGSIATEHLASASVPGGMIQHWIGAVFLPGTTLAEIEQVDQDYADYGRMYSPDISRPRVLSHQGNHFVVSYRITKKKFLTAVLDTVHAIDYLPIGPDRLTIQSRSQSVRQVEEAGTPSERVLAQGEGDGLLWAMNSYWRMQQRDGGVYLECEAVTLSREVPLGMGKMIEPILQSFAEESLKRTLEAKKRAVESAKRVPSAKAVPSAKLLDCVSYGCPAQHRNSPLGTSASQAC